MEKPSEIQSELDNFREQWRAEVSARSKNAPPQQEQEQQHQARAGPSKAPISLIAPPRKTDHTHKRVPSKDTTHHDHEEDYVQTHNFDVDPHRGKTIQSRDDTVEHDKEPETALEYYEKAVDNETSGKLGDSLSLYRKAYRMDSRVDQDYRDKHFPGVWKKKTADAQPAQPNPSNAAVTVPNTAHHSQESAPVLSIPDLIASFAGLGVQAAPPVIEGMPQPPCPISELPEEILVHILRDVAVIDVGDFMRLSRVCKRFAYLIATQSQIWRRICLGAEFGFGGMVYHWQRGHSWEELDPNHELDDDTVTMGELFQRRAEESEATTNALYGSVYPSWQRMFQQRPRIRFNGCYISTVNYIRTGHASGNHITWNSPVHIVTYYRYLRFFRDGTVISLLTTTEPTDVVHHLTKPLLQQHAKGGAPHLPSAIVSRALKGRWRLSSSIHNPDVAPNEAEGELVVETDGVDPKYMYRMEFSMKSAGKARNNKLNWKSFWSYNKLTDDWGEFGLKNDKAFYFSRVKSYGFSGER
ncbi:hypothetical protein BKA67DRAFT_553823 [Truncatella angustata]|uniref:F-box domain-containing protein n=1 Tax=Truncatella angustata TaxID=152316 RepID=A0A9P8URC8_9PEZI|nr:uncharacterized protein BKA67DRAFT_553823 [Truncatella angustata]KAH6656954.1 hypothetical protein BKA67DRAFT_553823 [Truncatella angustata]KAH8195881.1 hypothetical protein TruAng_009957 [Truncatella angustata]